MTIDLSGLVQTSRNLGKKISYIQGGGGNTSIKTNDNKTMYIKASGKSLIDINAEDGFLPLNIDFLRNGLDHCQCEADYIDLLKNSITRDLLKDHKKSRQPSIETGFHALLGPCVIHTHSVFVNTITCSVEGCSIAKKLIPEAIWIDYATPGLPLTNAIKSTQTHHIPAIFFLQNHGIIISAASPSEAEKLHETINQTIANFFNGLPNFQEDIIVDFEDRGILFPDQVIYQYNPLLASSRVGIETAQAYHYIVNTIPQLGLTLNFLEEDEKAVLLNMESEKYRQQIARA